jgi:hypothetical protein
VRRGNQRAQQGDDFRGVDDAVNATKIFPGTPKLNGLGGEEELLLGVFKIGETR